MTSIDSLVAPLSQLPHSTLAILAPIESEEAYDVALAAEEVLGDMVRGDKSHPLGGVYRTLLEHIAAYEAKAYPTPEFEPHEMLAFLMEQQGLRQSELAERMEITQGTVSRLLSGKMKYTAEWINRLSKALGVSGAVFVRGT